MSHRCRTPQKATLRTNKNITANPKITNNMKRFLSNIRTLTLLLLLAGFTSCQDLAEVYVTSGAGEMQFRFAQFNNAELRAVTPAKGNYIRLLSESRRQPIYGFGAAITGSTCYNLLKMNEEDREKILQECFSPEEMAMSFIRISIGASDFHSMSTLVAIRRELSFSSCTSTIAATCCLS